MRPLSLLIGQYRFELILLLVELLAGLIVAVTLLKLLAPAWGQVLAAAPEPARPVQVARLAPLPAQPVDPPGIFIEMREIPAPVVTVAPVAVEPSSVPWPSPVRPTPAGSDAPLAFWPVPGAVSQDFGCSPYFSGLAGPDCPAAQPWFHDGLDIAAAAGTPVRAGLAGTVLFAGPDGDGPVCGDYHGYGLGVVVDNGQGWQSLYAHLAAVHVTAGQAVTPETVLGAVGETGCTTGPHLHFGLRRAGKLVDPRPYLTQ